MGASGNVLIALLVIGGIALAIWLGRKRRKDLKMWATSNGLSFSHLRDGSFDNEYPEFGCLRRGHSRYAYNISAGTWGTRRVTCFDYHYATGSGKNRHDYRFSAALVGSNIPLKQLRIRPEGFLDKVTEFFGVDDIDFESAEFSRSFHVKAGEKRWAYDVLHQRTMEFLLGMPRFSIEFDERDVLIWRNRRFRPEDFEQAIAVVEGILDRLPGYVIDQQKS